MLSFSEDFFNMYKDTSKVPSFVRLMPVNKVDGIDSNMVEDIYLDKCNRLVVSEKAIKILEEHRISNCDIEQLG